VRKWDTTKGNYCFYLSPDATATSVAGTSSEYLKEKVESLGIWFYSLHYEVCVPVSYSLPIRVCLSF
jgi:hypothetical protein